MTVEYSLKLFDPRGRMITDNLTGFSTMELALKVNEVGSLALNLPSQYPLWWFGRDYRIEVWRSIDENPAYLEGDTQFLIRKINLSNSGGSRDLSISAFDLKHLLKRRIVAYDAASVYADKSDYADDMMKEIISENYGLGCIDGDRDISDWLDIQADFGLAFPVEKAFSRREVLLVCQELCQMSYENGIYCAFDIVRISPSKCEFRTYINQRGMDHTKLSPKPLIFGYKYRNFVNDEYLDDGTEEATFIYAGGQGEEASRVIETAQDDERISVSPFGRIEHFIDARNAKLAATVQDEAETELRARLPKHKISGDIADTDACRYGLNYKFGDRTTIETDEASMDAFVNSVQISVSNGAERIKIGMEATW
jgi:hypothetical protein